MVIENKFDSKMKSFIEAVALETGSYLVDLSHLTLLDAQNRAKDEINYKGDKLVWKADGKGAHSGDIGMENIAQQSFVMLNVLLASQKK